MRLRVFLILSFTITFTGCAHIGYPPEVVVKKLTTKEKKVCDELLIAGSAAEEPTKSLCKSVTTLSEVTDRTNNLLGEVKIAKAGYDNAVIVSVLMALYNELFTVTERANKNLLVGTATILAQRQYTNPDAQIDAFRKTSTALTCVYNNVASYKVYSEIVESSYSIGSESVTALLSEATAKTEAWEVGEEGPNPVAGITAKTNSSDRKLKAARTDFYSSQRLQDIAVAEQVGKLLDGLSRMLRNELPDIKQIIESIQVGKAGLASAASTRSSLNSPEPIETQNANAIVAETHTLAERLVKIGEAKIAVDESTAKIRQCVIE